MNFYVYPIKLEPDRTTSVLLCESFSHDTGLTFLCFLIEDGVREVEGQPVSSWKIPGKTAIPSGRYRFGLDYSPKFGPDTPTISDVEGFSGIRMHANKFSNHVSEDSSEGCPIPGLWIWPEGKLGGDEQAAELVKRKLKEAGPSFITFYRKV